MLNLSVIGAGAAGNKAAIALMEKGFNKDYVTLINSTSKDLPEQYKDNAIIFGASATALGGCGKERDIGKKLILDDMRLGKINLDNVVNPNTNAVVVVSSTEGGSGSAATPVIAKYIKEVLGVPVIVVLLFGFNTDVRGMQNSIEICQELQDTYGIIGISNAKFIDRANKNTLKAEQMANEQFVRFIEILSGCDIIPGSQNIDDTDLFKLVTTPGYMMIEEASINKIKNIDQYNQIITSTIDNSTLVDCSIKGAKRIGIIYNTSDSIADNIDYTASVIETEYGKPYEMFTHVQESNKPSVTWIATGIPMPINEIKEIYENYLRDSSSVNKAKDEFFDTVMGMKGNEEDGMFNVLEQEKKTTSKAAFFADFGIGSTAKETKATKKDASSEY